MIRRLRSKGLTFRQIAELANCSQGSVALEIKEWEAEKAAGVEKDLDAQINEELSESTAQFEQEQSPKLLPPAIPVKVVRF